MRAEGIPWHRSKSGDSAPRALDVQSFRTYAVSVNKLPTINIWIGDKLMEFVPKDTLAAPTKWNTGNDCIDHILNGGHFTPLLDSPDLPTIRCKWRAQLGAAVQNLAPNGPEQSMAFHTQWHVCHHRIRELVEDDELMTDLAWAWLPRYQGPSMQLYRGENIDRFEAGKIGSAWSDQETTAERFARSQNNEGKGGVILRTNAPAEAIIARPSDHSDNCLHEHEFTVDTRLLGEIEQLQHFPPRP